MATEHSGDRLRQYLGENHITPTECAALIGVSTQVLNNWFARGISGKKLVHAAKSLGLRVEWLEIGEGPAVGSVDGSERGSRPVEANTDLLGMIDAWEEGDPLDDDDCEVPYYAEVEFAGGNGMSEVVEVAGRKLRFSNATLRAAGVDCASAAVARISGNSMERLIMDGAAIGFDMSDTSIIDGEIYAFNQGGLLRTKYLFRMPGGGVRIKSENEADHPEETMTAAEWREQVKMLGRVFWWSTVRRSPRRR